MEEKKNLTVDTNASDKIASWQTLFSVLGWICIIAGIILTIIGNEKADSLYPNSTTLLIGVSVFITAFFFFFGAIVLRGIKVLVKNAEYNNSILEEEYNIKKKIDPNDYNVTI